MIYLFSHFWERGKGGGFKKKIYKTNEEGGERRKPIPQEEALAPSRKKEADQGELTSRSPSLNSQQRSDEVRG